MSPQQRSSRARGNARAVLALALVQAVTIGAVAQATPAPDFAHRDDPHLPLFSFEGGSGVVPLLVIVTTFDDAPLPTHADTLAEIRARVFGAEQSVRDYLRVASGGRMWLLPALDQQGAHNDGIVFVNAGGWRSYFSGLDPEIRRSMDLADAVVDFARFDADRDGTVEQRELAVLLLRAPRPGFDDSGGNHRGAQVARLDGIEVGFNVAVGGANTNLATHLHELMHLLHAMPDFYGYGMGQYGTDGPTPRRLLPDGTPDEQHTLASAYTAMHLGWIEHRVPLRDGWVAIPPRAGGGDVVVAHDRAAGTDRFLILENRSLPAGTGDGGVALYDNAPPDRGLLIWNVREDLQFRDSPEHLRPIELVRQDGTRIAGCVDDDVDGRQDEDAFLAARGIIRGGLVDVDGNSVIDARDDARAMLGSGLFPALDGWIDVNRDGQVLGTNPDPAVLAGDTAVLSGVQVIGGRVDVNGDAVITSADTGDPWVGDQDGDGAINEDAYNAGCGMGSGRDAWDPFDGATPARTFEGPLPGGGTPPAAVRNVWPVLETDTPGQPAGWVRAFVDLPGPGVMVDTYDAHPLAFAFGDRTIPRILVHGGATVTVPVVVRNTNDAGARAERFSVVAAGPAGWSSRIGLAMLEGQTEAVVPLTITAPRTPVTSDVELTVTATSIDGAGGESSSPLLVRLRATPPPPDRYEGTSSVISLALAHTHGAAAVGGGRHERWTASVSDVNLHSSTDSDRYRMRLPTPGESHPELAGLPDCGTVRGSGGDWIVSSSLRWRSRTLPPGTPIRADGDSLGVDDDGVIDLTAACPLARYTTDWRFVDFLYRIANEDAFPTYGLDASYDLEALFLSDKISRIHEMASLDAKAVQRLLCPGGGAFPACADADAGANLLDLAHPYLPGRECAADGCTDWLVFTWDGMADFLATIKGGVELEASLWKADGTFVTSFDAKACVDCQQSFISGTSDEPSVSDGDETPREAFVADLPEGVYLLRVDGPEGTYRLEAPRTPSALDTKLTADEVSMPEPGGATGATLSLRNAHATATIRIDGLGGDVAYTCQTPLSIAPGQTVACQGSLSVGSAPGDVPVATSIAGTLGDVPLVREASATVVVEDVLPDAMLSFTSTGTVPETGGTAHLDLTLDNVAAGTLRGSVATVSLWQDHDGDGFTDEGETSSVDAKACAFSAVKPGEAATCSVEVAVSGTPWSDPAVRATMTGMDDEGNSWAATAVAIVDVVGTTTRSLTTGRLAVTVDHDRLPPHGHATEEPARTYLYADTTVTPEGAAALITGVEVVVDGRDAECHVGLLPVVIEAPTSLRATCVLDGTVPDGQTPAVSMRFSADGTSTPVVANAPRRWTVAVDVMPGSDENPVRSKESGQVPVAILSDGDFDATSVEPSSVCFGRRGAPGDCSEEHLVGHIEDADADGDLDLVMHFERREAGFLGPGFTLACLSGRTIGGAPVEGCDLVHVHG